MNRRAIACSWIFGALLGVAGVAAAAPPSSCPALFDRSLRPLAEQAPMNLCQLFRGKVVLMVNTASKCGFTDQYDGLEKLYEQYRARGLVVAGFPSNDFLGQEPGTETQIRDFCRLTYSVKFPMFEKVSVRGDGAHPLYHELARQGGGYPRWNFHKYLVSREGRVVASFSSYTAPHDRKLIDAIERELAR